MEGIEKPLVSIVMVGHVDHGKSTLIGRLRQDAVTAFGAGALERFAADSLAFAIDQLQEERDRMMTIDTAQTFLDTPELRLVLIDVPGHQELIQNMLSGATRADAAVLVLAADEGVQVQTRRHAFLVGLLGVTDVILVVNKMDLADWSEAAFRQLVEGISAPLTEMGVQLLAAVPVAAATGANVLAHAPEMPWYDGPSLLELLVDLRPRSTGQESPRFPVQDIYRFEAEPVVVGRLLSGTVAAGDELTVLPSSRPVKVRRVRRFPDNGAMAVAGESVGLELEGGTPERGEVLAAGERLPQASLHLLGRVFWLDEAPLVAGEELSVRCATAAVTGRVTELTHRLDSSTLEPLGEGGSLARMELATVTIDLDAPLVHESFSASPGLGRFVLERRGQPVAFGIVP
jgi:small GTP-binding protein